MEIKKSFLLRNVANTNIIVPVAQDALQFKGMLSLNETGAFLWKCLEKPCTREELLEDFLAEYDVERETAEKDVDEFLEKVRSYGALNED